MVVALTLLLQLALIPINFRTVLTDWQVAEAAWLVAPFVARSTFALYVLVLRYMVLAVYLATAALVVLRRSNDWMALLVSLTLVTLTVSFGLGGYSETWNYYPFPWQAWLGLAREGLTFLVSIPALLALFFLFPHGRPTPRWLGWAALALGAAAVAVIHSRARQIGWGDWTWTATVLSVLALMLLALAGQIYRYRRLSTPSDRQQTRWVLLSLGAFVGGFLVQFPLAYFIEDSPFDALAALINIHLWLAILALLPLSIAVSILRYRLWGIDLILNRALVYGALTLMTLGLYMLTVGALGALFNAASNLLLSILATGLVASLFHPLRQRLQRGINRLMYGERDDPASVVTRLGQRLESTLAPADVLPTITETVAQALKLPYAAIAVKQGEGFSTLAEYHSPAAHLGTAAGQAGPGEWAAAPVENFPFVYQSEVIGWLLVAPRAPGEALGTADRRVLEQIARQASPAVHALRLTADLQRSRERLVTAREEERRRLRRDLHDGLGTTLAALHLEAGAVRGLIRTDPAAAEAAMEALRAEIRSAVADIRRLVYDLRPPALDELGLVGAIRARAAQCDLSAARDDGEPLRVLVSGPETLPPLPAAVEVAAYRIVQEALNNVVQHAQARLCEIRLWLDAGLQVEVVDNGRGLPVRPASGVGLRSMQERTAELGGTWAFEASPAGGTRIRVSLPLPESPQPSNDAEAA